MSYVKAIIKVSKRTGECSLKLTMLKRAPKQQPTLVPSTDAELNITDIALFTTSSSFVGAGRSVNDKNNKSREAVLATILELPMTHTFFTDATYGPMWQNVRDKFAAFLDAKLQSEKPGLKYDTIKVQQKAGRGHNFDFTVDFVQDGGVVHSIAKLEFKNGRSLDSLPQILSLPIKTSNFLDAPLYSDFYRENYLHRVAKLFGEDVEELVPDATNYNRLVGNTSYACSPFFKVMYDMEASVKAEKKALVDDSISEYLNRYAVPENMYLDAINAKLKSSQVGKLFAMWDGTDFIEDGISADDIELTNEYHVKNKNSICFVTKNRSIVSFLLRWRNHAGILNPAFQISFSRSR
jgi:hypothetical protein